MQLRRRHHAYEFAQAGRNGKPVSGLAESRAESRGNPGIGMKGVQAARPGFHHYTEKRFAPATQIMAPSVTISIVQLTVSLSNSAARARPMNGCSNCSWPTA